MVLERQAFVPCFARHVRGQRGAVAFGLGLVLAGPTAEAWAQDTQPIEGPSEAIPPRSAPVVPENTKEPAPAKPPVGLPPSKRSFVQYGVSIASEFVLTAGAMCPPKESCILGSGAGVGAHIGWRSPGPWYFGGAYELTKQDSATLYRLATLQQLRGEVRYYVATGYDTKPFVAAGAGFVGYGNEWAADSSGPLGFLSLGSETELSGTTVASVALSYRAAYFHSFAISSLGLRPDSIAHFVAFEVSLEALDPIDPR